MNYPRLKDLREDKDLRQKDIADIINTSANYYGDYEKGKRQIPFDRVIELANFYNVSLDYIAGRTNDKKGFNKSDLPSSEVSLLKDFRNLSERQKGIIIGRIEAFKEENERVANKEEKIKGAI